MFLAHKHGKPLLRISRDGGPTSAGQALLRFLQEKPIECRTSPGREPARNLAFKSPDVLMLSKV